MQHRENIVNSRARLASRQHTTFISISHTLPTNKLIAILLTVCLTSLTSSNPYLHYNILLLPSTLGPRFKLTPPKLPAAKVGARKKQIKVNLWNNLKAETAKALDNTSTDKNDKPVKAPVAESESSKTTVTGSKPATATPDKPTTNVPEIKKAPVNKSIEATKSTEKQPTKHLEKLLAQKIPDAPKPIEKLSTKKTLVTQKASPKSPVKAPEVLKAAPQISPTVVPTPTKEKTIHQSTPWAKIVAEVRENSQHTFMLVDRIEKKRRSLSEQISELHATLARSVAAKKQNEQENGQKN
ncbi:hypothetical protein AOL_s00097g118 [Orbilia oligospora ATCC 24927]|uniref:Uncharacterized protein n=1 Tax=Arthrobotrys oligospora (strain ATCC 24927 / CBS 115.81 / DSM 1491) TaxID=756982 RepID=G1XIE1_ARTOA|nr:hypothetical protein AOL_s00097g118 [Orbilia oligospora ATCC 24927]EGX47072.1 hypothetical protein AOL_s00097g118 [Orbilia oligospora ATCC 24927]